MELINSRRTTAIVCMAGCFRRRHPLGVVCFALCFVSSIGELQRFEHQAKADGSVSLLVIGDWGRKGDFNQSHVAHQMGVIGDKLDISFVVSTGDNFYDKGLRGVDDPAFEESFSNIYTAPSLQKKWYSVLGNHDYRGDAVAQISPVLRKIDGRWLCLRSFRLNSGIADLFFIDTTPFVDNYFSDPGGQTYDWRDVQPRESYLPNSLKDLDLALRESTAKWKIVIGHHAIRSISHHGDTPELVKFLLPILKANDVDFYMNGHDHCLEHINDINSPIQFLTSGAGSKAWRGDVRPNSGGVKFFYDGQGFMSMELTQSRAEIGFYDVHGTTLHRWARLKEEFRSEA